MFSNPKNLPQCPPTTLSSIFHRRDISGGQKKGRPNDRPHVALDCCAPYVHPYTTETSLQLALPAPYKCVGTSLLASLLQINICPPLVLVKQIMIILDNITVNNIIVNINKDIYQIHFFNILKNNVIFCLFLCIPEQKPGK